MSASEVHFAEVAPGAIVRYSRRLTGPFYQGVALADWTCDGCGPDVTHVLSDRGTVHHVGRDSHLAVLPRQVRP